MWIMTQNEQRIINSDQIIDIFISKTGTKVIAETTKEDVIALGEYKDRDTCFAILNYIHTIIGAKMPGIIMPFGGDVENWEKSIDELAKAYIASDFRR